MCDFVDTSVIPDIPILLLPSLFCGLSILSGLSSLSIATHLSIL